MLATFVTAYELGVRRLRMAHAHRYSPSHNLNPRYCSGQLLYTQDTDLIK